MSTRKTLKTNSAKLSMFLPYIYLRTSGDSRHWRAVFTGKSRMLYPWKQSRCPIRCYTCKLVFDVDRPRQRKEAITDGEQPHKMTQGSPA